MITSVDIDRGALETGALDDRVDGIVEVGLRLAHARQGPEGGRMTAAGDEQLLRREARDHLAAVLRDDELLLDPRRRPAVRRGPERLEREHHPFLDLDRVVEGDEPAEDRLLPDRQADA